MPKISFQQADHAAEQLSKRLGEPDWLRGVGVERDSTGGFAVSVRVAPDVQLPSLPKDIDGVSVHVVRREMPQASIPNRFVPNIRRVLTRPKELVALLAAIVGVAAPLQHLFESVFSDPKRVLLIALGVPLSLIFASMAIVTMASVATVAGQRFVASAGPVATTIVGWFHKGWIRYTLLVGVVVVCLSSVLTIGVRTEARYIVRAWVSGPKVDLTVNSPTVGVNLPWINYGADFGEVTPWGWRGVSKNSATANRFFKELKKAKVDYVTWFLFGDGRASPEWNRFGLPTGLDPHFLQDYDAAIQIARENDVGILWVVLDYHALMPERIEHGARLGGHANMVMHRDKRLAFLNVLEEVVRRYPREPNIVGWISMNEPENAIKEGLVPEADVVSFLEEMARRIRRIAPRQPVSVGHTDLESLVRISAAHPDLSDFLVFHHYRSDYLESRHYENIFPPTAEYVRQAIIARRSGHMPRSLGPLYIGEFDAAQPPMREEWPKWTYAAGYAGVWPWSLTTLKDHGPCPGGFCIDLSHWEDQINTGIDPQFSAAFSHRHGEHGLSAQDRESWRNHGMFALDRVSEQVEILNNEIAEHKKKYQENAAFLARSEQYLAASEDRKRRSEQALHTAEQNVAAGHEFLKNLAQERSDRAADLHHAEDLYEQARARGDDAGMRAQQATINECRRLLGPIQGGTLIECRSVPRLERPDPISVRESIAHTCLRESEQARENAQHELERANSVIEEQHNNVRNARHGMQDHARQIEWKTWHLALLEDLYMRFWREEIGQ